MKEIKNYDSTFCGNLPIHMINVIQPYGALIIVNRESGEIIQVSENLSGIIHRSARETVGLSISEIIPGGIPFSVSKEKVPQVISIQNRNYLGYIHNKPGFYIVELNLDSEKDAADNLFVDVYAELRSVMPSIEQAGDLRTAAETVSKELKKASGFDKVMIYRFDPDWNGHVVAEAMEPDMESYLNFTFPASDIPKQARDLYEKNPYRFIPDTEFVPVGLFPKINPLSGTFVDLSDCNVRGVSAVHLEYLANMHVKASMSTRIMKDGKLWGLIACHHKTAMRVSYRMCAYFELLSGIFSSRVSSLETKDVHVFKSTLSGIYAGLIEETYRTGNLIASLFESNGNLLKLFGAGGAAFIDDGKIIKSGTVPDDNEIDDILLWIESRETEDIFATDSLSDNYHYATEYTGFASGMIVIPIDIEKGRYILIFRPEVVKTINWGGNPDTRINFEEDMRTYHPRFSFKLWQEMVKGVSAPWHEEEIRMAQNLQDFVRDFSNGKSQPKA